MQIAYTVIKPDAPRTAPGQGVMRLNTADETQVYTPTPVVPETDAEIIARHRELFGVLVDMTKAIKSGHIRSMIVSGAPGIGKSHEIEQTLEPYKIQAHLSDNHFKSQYEFIKGNMSPVNLYMKLYEHRDRKSLLILDDLSSVFTDETSLDLLKAALDSNKERIISWRTQSRVLVDEGIPNSFEFQGGVIFITNLALSNVRSAKLRAHLEALESRSHYIDLKINSEREKMLRIRQCIEDGMLERYYFEDEMVETIIQFIDDNRTKMRELSLRTVIKCADLVKSFPDKWQEMARITLNAR